MQIVEVLSLLKYEQKIYLYDSSHSSLQQPFWSHPYQGKNDEKVQQFCPRRVGRLIWCPVDLVLHIPTILLLRNIHKTIHLSCRVHRGLQGKFNFKNSFNASLKIDDIYNFTQAKIAKIIKTMCAFAQCASANTDHPSLCAHSFFAQCAFCSTKLV